MSAPASVATSANSEDQYRQVQWALRPRVMGEYLKEVFASHGADTASKGGAGCRILDVKYLPGSSCIILYQLGDQMVIGALNWDEDHRESFGETPLIAPLGMRVYRAEDDPALPGLLTALDPERMARVLTEALPECRAGAARVLRCRVMLVRYRPGKRCTVRFEVWLRHTATGAISSRMLFGKLYHSASKAVSVYEAMGRLFDSAPARGGQLTLARPAAFLPDLQLVLQEPVGGMPLDLLLAGRARDGSTGDQRASNGVVRAGAALAALHTARVSAKHDRSVAAELARFEQRAAKVATVNTDLGAQLSGLTAALRGSSKYLQEWGSELSFIHGDCKPSQFLIGPAHVALLDFDHCGMADPASDVGMFLASLRQFSIRQTLKSHGNPRWPVPGSAPVSWLETLEQQFLEEYCAASACHDKFRLRAVWYEAVALLRKAVRAFARSPYSPLPSALVTEAWQCLRMVSSADATP